MQSNSPIKLSKEVAEAKANGAPIVCLESTVFSKLGLPSPSNAEALELCISELRKDNVVPAVSAVIDGELRLGLEESEYDQIFSASTKVSVRDLPIAVGKDLNVGVTTVSASLAIAHAAGERVFCTGGIGGVHRGASLTGDISADLHALAKFNVVCVSAGAKVFLDLPATLEFLETLGVPVLGWQTDQFPAFYLRNAGLEIERVNSAKEVVTILDAIDLLDLGHGVLLNVPIPSEDELDAEKIWTVIQKCIDECDEQGISGQEVTPFILEQLAAGTEGESIPANLALLKNNAKVASQIARSIYS
jgi:pseudouridine-5'-phosphate glycosidase